MYLYQQCCNVVGVLMWLAPDELGEMCDYCKKMLFGTRQKVAKVDLFIDVPNLANWILLLIRKQQHKSVLFFISLLDIHKRVNLNHY